MTPRIVVLAGGQGARMGGNKPFAAFEKSTLIETVIARLKPQTREVVINAGARGSALSLPLSALGLRLIFDDDYAGLGPLSGVLSALEMAGNAGETAVITAPCDMPHLPEDMAAQLLAAPAADVVCFASARDYPLCALWQVSLLTRLRSALEAAQPGGGLAVMAFLRTQNVHKIAVHDDTAFANINHP